MADKGTTPDPADRARSRKRQAPTIDLTAKDVLTQSAAPKADESAGPTPQQHSSEDRSHSAEPETAEPETVESGVAQRQHGWRWDWPAARQVFAGGVAGAAIVAIVLFGLWLSGFVPSRYAETIGADPAAVAALNQRVARLEATIVKLPENDKAISERATAADNAMKSLGIALAALNKRSDEVAATAADAHARADASDKAVTELRNGMQKLTRNTSAGLSPADLDTVQKRLAALEQAAKGGPADRPARLAVIAAALREAAARGAPFSAELNEAKSLGADEKFLTALAPFAASGMPTPASMVRELSALIPSLVKASGVQAPAGGFLERLEANAEKLVRIHPVNAPPGNEATAVLTRLEIDVAHANINGALADLGKLDATTRAPAQDWIERARARQAALAAVDQLAAAATRALGKR
ncbi:MAG TPA: hypothetical protein VFI98_07875 [Pseudolabrys sp.]|nr:hypothetical protein [Pseudolabrys sp.]